MVDRSYKTVTRKVDVEICTTKDGKVFEGYDAWHQASQHETNMENLAALDTLFDRDPSVVKAAIIAHFKDEDGESGSGLWCFLHDLSKHIPKGVA